MPKPYTPEQAPSLLQEKQHPDLLPMQRQQAGKWPPLPLWMSQIRSRKTLSALKTRLKGTFSPLPLSWKVFAKTSIQVHQQNEETCSDIWWHFYLSQICSWSRGTPLIMLLCTMPMLLHQPYAHLVYYDKEHPKWRMLESCELRFEEPEEILVMWDALTTPPPSYPTTLSRGAVNPQQDHQTYHPSSACKHKTKLTVTVK